MADYAARRVMMVDTQVRPSDVTKFPIIDAMLAVPREAFVPARLREAAFVGENLPLAPGRVILEPRTLAKLLDGLDLLPTDTVLDVGCGLGYGTAVMSHMCEFVVGVEADEGLAAEAQTALTDAGIDKAVVITAPLTTGAPDSGPYDAILIEGGIEVLPDTFGAQLKEGGRIGALFHEGGVGVARIGWKTGGRISWRFAFNAGAPVIPGFAREQEFNF